VGNNFAMMEMRLVLATIAQPYHLDLVSGLRVVMEPVITLRPKYGIVTALRPRAAASNGTVHAPPEVASPG
jgi:cytochrome P450